MGSLLVVAALCLLAVESAHGAETEASKTYWHSVGNDRFRAYDAGGRKEPMAIEIPTGFGKWRVIEVTIPWHSIEPDGSIAGPNPYRSSYSTQDYWAYYRDEILDSNERYSKKVDWPVTFLFKNQASISYVKEQLVDHKIDEPGSRMYLSLADSRSAGSGPNLWDADGGLKEFICSNPWTGIGPEATNHIRLYADSQGSGFKGNRNHMMVNRHWGYYVLGTTHIDYLECPGDAKKFGWSEAARQRLTDAFYPAFNRWNPGGCVINGEVMASCYKKLWMANKESGREGDHIWESDGYATVVRVGEKPEAFSSEDDTSEEDGSPPPDESEGEGPPPADPAIDGDVNGDNHAELVSVHTSKTAYAFNPFDGHATTSQEGSVDSALFDGAGEHVVDVADVGADGYADMVALGSDGTVRVYPGEEGRVFGAPVTAKIGMTPGTVGPSGHEPIGIADVTGDKRGDLVTFYAPQGNFYVYPGRWDNTFGDGITHGGGGINSATFDREGSYFVDVADVNGNGYADVVAVKSAVNPSVTGKAQVFGGSPSGIGQYPSEYGPAVDPVLTDGAAGHEPLGVGDVNGDGKADLVTLNPSGSIAVYAGTSALHEGSQTPQYLSTTAVTSLPGQNSSLMDGTGDDFIGLIDFSGDGKADLLKTTPEGGMTYRAAGQSNLTFGSFQYFTTGVVSNRGNVTGHELVQEKPFIRRVGCTPQGCSGRPQPPEADVNGDRRSDLVTLDTTGTAHTFGAVGAGQHATTFHGSMDPALYDGKGHYVIDVADVTGDFRADKVTLYEGTVFVYPGKPDGTFGTGVGSFAGSMTPGPRDATGFEPIAVADVNGDGKSDLVAFKSGQGVKMYPGNANGTFGAGIVTSNISDSALFDRSGYYFLDVGDVTGDRLADLVTMNSYLNFKVWTGSASGQFTLLSVSSIEWYFGANGLGHDPLGLGDVNGDGFADLVTLYQGAVYAWTGGTTGSFDAWRPRGISPLGLDSNLKDGVGDEIVGLLDENGDKKADLVTVREDGTARVFRGKADLTFSATPDARLLSDFVPGRFRKIPGHEIATEKPFFLRAGCSRADCSWPVRDTDGDVGGDERADLVAVEHGSNAARIFSGVEGGFGTSGAYAQQGLVDSAMLDGNGEYAIDVASVDGDRQSDLVAVRADGEVRVYPGRADHQLLAAIDAEVSIPPVMNGAGIHEPIAVDDVNGDGFDDLVVFSGLGVGKLVTYLGRADDTFDQQSSVTTTSLTSALADGSGQYFLDVTDVSGDGRADLVMLNDFGGVSTMKGQADGTFAAMATLGGATYEPVLDDGSGYEPIGLGDVTGDGKADLALLDSAGAVKLRPGTEGGLFGTEVSTALAIDSNLVDGTGDEVIGLLDYDRNGRADLVTLTSSGYRRIYHGKADGTFGAGESSFSYDKSIRQGGSLEYVAQRPLVKRAGCKLTTGCALQTLPSVPSDVDGDRSADMVTLHSNGTVAVYKGDRIDGVGYPAGSPLVASTGIDPALRDGVGRLSIGVGDINGDGRSDWTMVDGGSVGAAYVSLGEANGKFAPAINAGISMPVMQSGKTQYEPIGVADMNRDDRADLIAAQGPGSGKLIAYFGQADGKFSAPPISSLEGTVDSALPDATGKYFLGVGDTTGDGSADVVAVTNTGSLTLYAGQPTGAFMSPVTTSGLTVDPIMDNGTGHEPLGVADVDGDAKADLVTLDATGAPKLFRGQADGTFAAPTSAYASGTIDSTLNDGIGTEVVGLLDFNGDTLGDLVTIDPEGYVVTQKANGDGMFSTTLRRDNRVRTTQQRPYGHQLLNQVPWRRQTGCKASGCAWPPAPPAPINLGSPAFPLGDGQASHWRAAVIPQGGEIYPARYALLGETEFKKLATAPPVTPPYSGTTVLKCTAISAGNLYIPSFFDAPIALLSNPTTCPTSETSIQLWPNEVCVYVPEAGKPGSYWVRQQMKAKFGSSYGEIAGAVYGKGLYQGTPASTTSGLVDAWKFEEAPIGTGSWKQNATYKTSLNGVALEKGTGLQVTASTAPCGWPGLQ